MVKNKRDIITPRRRNSLIAKQKILDRTITKAFARPASESTKDRASTANIKVIVRVRPTNSREQTENNRTAVKVVDDDMLVFDPQEEAPAFFFHGIQQKGRDLLKKAKKNMKFNFDRVYPPDSTNDEVFKGTTHSLIDNIMDGYNCSVFAYGATGAGKTFTMTGTSDSPGITFLTMRKLFDKQEELAMEREFEIGITYLEVYNELVKDLLNPGPPLNLREDSNYGVIVSGIKVFKITNSDQLFSLLQQGNTNRTQHPTDANAESSRSHAVFQVYLKMTIRRTNEVRTAKLSMIDLAGSERGSATGFAGARFTEGANINKSLLALGNCINSLADGHRHVPYRDSKLTRLLKDSLGGNCQTVMIANISPSFLSFDDTYNTLKYATRASSIKASVHRNVTSKTEANVMQYVKLVEDLTKENQSVKQENQSLKEDIQSVKQENQDIKQELSLGQEKIESLQQECYRLQGILNNAASFEEVDELVINEIKDLTLRQRNLLERKFQLERNEHAAALKRLFKEEEASRLSDVCSTSSEKNLIRDKISSIIQRNIKQEIAFRQDIELTEDISSDIDQRLADLEMKYPQYSRFIGSEKQELLILREQHKVQIAHRYAELLAEDRENKVDLLDKTSGTLRCCYRLLQGHGYATPSLAKQYKDIVQLLQGKRNIKFSEGLDSGLSSMTSLQDDDEKLLVKQKIDTPDLNQTYSAPKVRKPRARLFPEPSMPSGKYSPSSFANARKYPVKSPRDKENTQSNLVSTSKRFMSAKQLVNQGVKKGILKTRPTPLMERPRFKR